MRILRVGSSSRSDIVIPDPTVSREHADLVEGANGKFYWIDRASTNGSWRIVDGQWVKFTKEFVEANDQIRLGQHQTTVSILLGGARHEIVRDQRPEGKVQFKSGRVVADG